MAIERRERRTEMITFRLTEAERLGAEAAARVADVPVSEIARAGVREMTRNVLSAEDGVQVAHTPD